ncbi:SDR family NAD(P)-dependent oxidoreductase [Actinomycetospora chiangmaiensis]|uniref:SDR family NAD(P)-dependent oxidoreductase n=1 Tax=Actinomycetospora chiangmaiensis TaxID=402650 RepID=UPI00039990E1|nr:SDR family oxidoreductase [Actinomycetospora chiangmaiensis]
MNRTAIVTGAGSVRGIGRATAHHLAAAGWHVAVLDLDPGDTAAEVADRHGYATLGLACDVTSRDAVDAAVAEVEATLPPVGGLVNNAGVTSPIPFLEVTDEEWERVFAVNVRGSYTVTRRVAPGMAERGFGRIVFLSSVSAERGGGVFGGVAYSAAKAGLLGFARALARELGPRGVTANAVAPGLVDTDITGGAITGERLEAMLAGIPTGRLGSVEDVANLVTFLCREQSATSPGPPTTSTAGRTSTEVLRP